jgi:hypothetical protein
MPKKMGSGRDILRSIQASRAGFKTIQVRVGPRVTNSEVEKQHLRIESPTQIQSKESILHCCRREGGPPGFALTGLTGV